MLPRVWLLTCSHVECQIYDISPPNLVGGHKHAFHGGGWQFILVLLSPYARKCPSLSQLWLRSAGLRWNSWQALYCQSFSVICFLSGVELFLRPFPAPFSPFQWLPNLTFLNSLVQFTRLLADSLILWCGWEYAELTSTLSHSQVVGFFNSLPINIFKSTFYFNTVICSLAKPETSFRSHLSLPSAGMTGMDHHALPYLS
jgi:hypothetical protein